MEQNVFGNFHYGWVAGKGTLILVSCQFTGRLVYDKYMTMRGARWAGLINGF